MQIEATKMHNYYPFLLKIFNILVKNKLLFVSVSSPKIPRQGALFYKYSYITFIYIVH